jgi:hypothetical protein
LTKYFFCRIPHATSKISFILLSVIVVYFVEKINEIAIKINRYKLHTGTVFFTTLFLYVFDKRYDIKYKISGTYAFFSRQKKYSVL